MLSLLGRDCFEDGNLKAFIDASVPSADGIAANEGRVVEKRDHGMTVVMVNAVAQCGSSHASR
jgi:hypothetical protein